MMSGRNPLLAIACAVVVFSAAMAAAAQHKKRSASPTAPRRTHQPAATKLPRVNLYTTAIRANNLGMALMDGREFTPALARFQTACVMNPASDTGCLNMGIALLYMGRLENALSILTKSVQRDAQNARAWFNLALVERRRGDDADAVRAFERVASLDPHDAATQYLIGSLYLKAKQYQEAISSFRNAIDLDRFNLPAEFGIAQAEGRMGDVDGALEHLNRAEQLTETGRGRPASTAYGEQGKYSLAQAMLAPIEPAPTAIPVRFVNVTEASGLPWRARWVRIPPPTHRRPGARETPGAQDSHEESQRQAAEPLAKFLGSGACLFDYNGDGRPDIFLADANGKGRAALYKNAGRGRFVDVTRQAHLELHTAVLGCAAADYDNDGHPDLALSTPGGILIFHNNGDGTFGEVMNRPSMNARGLVLGLAFIDYNDDGNLDLYATRFTRFLLAHPSQPFTFPANAEPPGNLLWRGNGRGAFADETKQAGVGGTAPSVSALACDLNNDGATDLVVTGWQTSPTIYFNQRQGAFRAVQPWAQQMPGPAAGAVALDFNHDGWIDLAFTHWSSPGLSLWRNVHGTRFERERLPGPLWMRGWGLSAVDYDQDGWVDLVAVGETFSGVGKILLLRNQGGDGHGGFAGFRDVTHVTGLDKVELRNPRSVVAFHSDRTTYLLVTQNDGPPVLLKAVGSEKNNSLQLALTGTRDNRPGMGSTLTVFAGAQRQTFPIGNNAGYLGSAPAEVTAGIGHQRGADVVRVWWPSALVQDDIDVAAGPLRRIRETDRGTVVR